MQVTKAPSYKCNSFSASIYANEIELENEQPRWYQGVWMN